MILLENSELAWMKTMQEYVVTQVSGAAVYSHVSRIKIIKAHPVMLHIQQHAKLLSSPMVPDNSGLTTCNQMLKENQGNLLLFYDLEVWVKYNYRKLGRERMYGQQDKPTILLVFTRNKTRVN